MVIDFPRRRRRQFKILFAEDEEALQRMGVESFRELMRYSDVNGANKLYLEEVRSLPPSPSFVVVSATDLFARFCSRCDRLIPAPTHSVTLSASLPPGKLRIDGARRRRLPFLHTSFLPPKNLYLPPVSLCLSPSSFPPSLSALCASAAPSVQGKPKPSLRRPVACA